MQLLLVQFKYLRLFLSKAIAKILYRLSVCNFVPFSPKQLCNKSSFAEQKEMFSDFTVDGTNMYTNLSMDISSTFFLKTMFTGSYDEYCGMTFDILDTDVMYHLDFRLHMKGTYRQLIQASKWNGQWGYKIPETRSPLPDLALENDIIVLVTDEYFEVTINNIMITPKFPSDLDRLYNYKGISLGTFGECIFVDIEKSYMTNGGNCYI